MSDITITGLRVRAVNAPLEYPVHTAVGTVSTSPLVLLDLETDAGVTGTSYLFAYTPFVLKSLQVLLNDVSKLVIGQKLEPVALESLFEQRFRLLGFTGLLRMAYAGIDMAAWDALAKAHKLPLVKLLGGKPKAIKSYDSHSMDGQELAVKRALDAVELGFTGLKTKIGYSTLREDLEVVRAIRKAVGDDVAIMVDYNQSQTVPEAIRKSLALQAEGVAWIEEPTLQHDYAGHAAIHKAVSVPIQMGENWLGPEDMAKSLAAGASSYGMPDAMKIGGVTGWLRASALAQQHGLPLSSHLFQEFSAHLLAVTPTAHWLERLDIAQAIIEPTLTFKDGNAVIPDLPGAGIVWRESEVARHLVP